MRKEEAIAGEIVRRLEELVSVPTPTGQEDALVPYLVESLCELGFDVTEQRISIGRKNIIGRRGRSRLMFCAHTDTIPAYTHPTPYKLRSFGSELIGRGVVDCKGLIAALLVALRLSESPCNVAFVADEEKSGLGSKELELPDSVRAAVVLEPTDFKLAIAHAGAIEIEVTTFGKATHGALPHTGVNAIEKAIELIERLKCLPALQRRHELFEDAPLFTLGIISGGCDVMVVPNRCTFQVDMRILPTDDAQAVLEQIREIISDAQSEMSVLDISQPVVLDLNDDVVASLVDAFKRAHENLCGEPLKCIGYHSWTDAVNLIERGICAVVYGGGKLHRAHSDWESITIDELVMSCNVYRCVMEYFVETQK
ncbi:MAG: M20/M25/M40 family metallo-hydrolase [Armatimonadota bacterium]|nr:M20/M25/M40 family metallo-hydrolase [Armatimonadota bacterium]MDW8026583.1 M20/M25/M40 family metallo-hydrolase [Armatimonadota bacterium]